MPRRTIERIKNAIAEGEKELEKAKILIKLAKRAGLRVEAEETELLSYEEKLNKLKEAVEETEGEIE